MSASPPSVPSEEVEQVYLVNWLEAHELKYTAIPNSTYTTSWKVKGRNTRMGVRAGFPDLVVLLPDVAGQVDGLLLAIELKRQRGGVVSKEQRAWIDALNGLNPGVRAVVCRGADEAIELIESYLRTQEQVA